MLNNQAAIVTGAAHPDGIGFAITRTLAEAGAGVVLVDLDADACERAAALLNAGLPAAPASRVIGMAADVRSGAALVEVVACAKERFGRLDVVVSNAGIAQARKLLDITDQDWQTTLDINLRGTLNLSQAAIPHMQDGGAIICIASIAAQRGGGLLGGPHYAASKGGVLALAKSMARELGPRSIRVNCINPGIIITPMNVNAFDEATQQRFIETIPLQRFGTPQDVANVCLFLASPLAGYITGTAVDINGGMHIH